MLKTSSILWAEDSTFLSIPEHWTCAGNKSITDRKWGDVEGVRTIIKGFTSVLVDAVKYAGKSLSGRKRFEFYILYSRYQVLEEFELVALQR